MEKIYVNSFFTIARQHRICQDYAVAVAETPPLLLLSDGCSSSQDTDIGSRLMVKSAERVLRAAVNPTRLNDDFQLSDVISNPDRDRGAFYQKLGSASLVHASAAADCLALCRSALDATLLIAMHQGDTVTALIYGDGCLAAVRRDGSLEYVSVSYADNLPYYLNYRTDEARKTRYLAENRGGKDVISMTTWQGGTQKTDLLDYDAPLVWNFPVHEYRLVALCSDGVAAFSSLGSGQFVPVEQILEGLLTYKTITGEFVTRRAKRLLKELDKQNIFPTDDVSIAVMLWE